MNVNRICKAEKQNKKLGAVARTPSPSGVKRRRDPDCPVAKQKHLEAKKTKTETTSNRGKDEVGEDSIDPGTDEETQRDMDANTGGLLQRVERKKLQPNSIRRMGRIPTSLDLHEHDPRRTTNEHQNQRRATKERRESSRHHSHELSDSPTIYREESRDHDRNIHGESKMGDSEGETEPEYYSYTDENTTGTSGSDWMDSDDERRLFNAEPYDTYGPDIGLTDLYRDQYKPDRSTDRRSKT